MSWIKKRISKRRDKSDTSPSQSSSELDLDHESSTHSLNESGDAHYDADRNSIGRRLENKVQSLKTDYLLVQKKTFTKWWVMRKPARGGGSRGAEKYTSHRCNVQLSKARRTSNTSFSNEFTIHDLGQDLRDGIRLAHLLEVLSGEKLPKPERTVSRVTGPGSAGALMRIYSIVNVDKCLKFLQSKLREPLSNIGSEDIVDGNLKLTMGLVWILILRFRIETIAVRDKRVSGQSVGTVSSDSFGMEVRV